MIEVPDEDSDTLSGSKRRKVEELDTDFEVEGDEGESIEQEPNTNTDIENLISPPVLKAYEYLAYVAKDDSKSPHPAIIPEHFRNTSDRNYGT
ncbi:25406_t:CDS:2 [Racocetra persica]|uniref:25406_t:CDS:1 n=1 Tax=Racocetra persica TaxID=160502 RepID=A0ACA9NR22_9GLOM|nr:25406_t:CDS:2 [Racocetra persica]